MTQHAIGCGVMISKNGSEGISHIFTKDGAEEILNLQRAVTMMGSSLDRVLKNTLLSRRLFKKVQMQGGAVPAGRQEEARSEAYLDVRCNDERPRPPFERRLRRRKLQGEVRK